MAKNDLEIVQMYDDYYQEAYLAWSPFYPMAERDLRAFLGDQWDEKEKQMLFTEGRNQFVFNRIRRNIQMITGYQRKHRLSSVVIPIENSDQATADLRTQLLLYAMQYADGYNTISDAFGGALKTGFNLLDVWMDYRDDPINGDIRIGRQPYSGFITDPYFTRLDFSDCAYIIRRKYLGVDQAASLLPKQEKDVYRLHEMGWSRDDKFTWLPYQRQPNGQDLLAYDEFFLQKWKNVPMLVNTETGEFTQWEGKEEELRPLVELHPELKIIKTPKRFIEKHILVNNEFMRTEVDPYGLDEYPMVPVVAIFEPESDLWELKMQSLVRCQIDPQKEINRRISQMTDIMDSQINSGWIATDGSVVNPRSLFQASQGKVIWRKKDAAPGSLEKIPPGQIPPSSFQLQELFDRSIVEILGINDASFGEPVNGNESGVMMMLRQGAAIVNLQDVFDNLRYSQKMLSKKILKLMQSWTPEKIKRITNIEPSEEFYNPDSVKYDVSIQEGLLTDTQKQMHFRQLVDLAQITGGPDGPITPLMLAQAAPIQGKTDLLHQIEANQKAAAEQAQAQQQAQQQAQEKIMELQGQASQAKALSDVALAKERHTRAIANLGLEDERAAKAVDDRASAALDRAKAAKELSELDDNRLMKYLSIIKMMEEMSQVEESQLKQEDVMITEQAEQGAQQANPAPQQPMQGEQINIDQTTEAFSG